MKKFLLGMVIQAFSSSLLANLNLINLCPMQQMLAGSLYLLISCFIKSEK